MAVIQHGGIGVHACVVDRFEAKDLGAPFKVILNEAVRASFNEAGDMLSYCIPDPDGLIRLIAMKRVLHRKKLCGADIKFLRKAIGVKQKEMAQSIEVSQEHLSRCEGGTLPLSPTAEKLLRVFTFKAAFKLHKIKACKEKTNLLEALDRLFDVIKPVAVAPANEELEFNFWLHQPDSHDQNEPEPPLGEWDCNKEAA